MRKTLMIAAAGAVLAVGGATAAVAAVPSPSPLPSAPRASTAVDEAAARSIATAAVPGGTVTEIALQAVQGRAVWKVHLGSATTRQEVFIDAADGRILSTEQSGGARMSASPTLTATRSGSPATSASADPDYWIPGGHGGLDDGVHHDLGDDHGGHH
jgi:hypothetical protein